ncbi:hypothetical protein EHS25_005634 [Saitozyma podzolica]|uniref:Uncharacterized protein n=1 Tax=Saitozyma podzolica TaxID=1890683 RepID=A0A427XY08_9TREE|nr:hypothetical protein EHS25_005634 [Saitozyma podzolica]
MPISQPDRGWSILAQSHGYVPPVDGVECVAKVEGGEDIGVRHERTGYEFVIIEHVRPNLAIDASLRFAQCQQSTDDQSSIESASHGLEERFTQAFTADDDPNNRDITFWQYTFCRSSHGKQAVVRRAQDLFGWIGPAKASPLPSSYVRAEAELCKDW